MWKPSAANRGTGTLSPKAGQFWTAGDGTIMWSRHGNPLEPKAPAPVAPNHEEQKEKSSDSGTTANSKKIKKNVISDDI